MHNNALSTFIDYRQPMRCRQTAVEMTAAFSVFAIGFIVASVCMWLASALPMLFPAFVLLGVVPFVIGVVAFVSGGSLLWSYATARTHVVQVTAAGVNYDGNHWPWESVLCIRSRNVLPTGGAYLSISVGRGVLRSRLSLPIEVRENDPLEAINKLKNYLVEAGHAIPWHSTPA
jgi:hypothetical protein